MKAKTHVFSLAAMVLLAGLVASAATWAASVTLTKQGPAQFGSTVASYVAGSVWPNPTYPVGSVKQELEEDIGGDSFRVDVSNTKSFKVGSLVNAWCADVNHELLDSQSYTLGTTKQISAVFDKTRAGNLQTLANQRLSGVDTGEESAAFQLAIWAILYGTPDSKGIYSLSSATFSATLGSDQAAVADLAQSWLNDLGSAAATASYTIWYFMATSQSLVAFTK